MLRIGGVPEHFNLPWRLAGEAGLLDDVRWFDQPEGTGQMTRSLAAGELDVIVALTEGTVAAIADGLDAEIVSVFVETPLQWGIHVAAAGPVRSEADLVDARFAISRFGSGSHLMSYLLAERLALTIGEDRFVPVGGIDALRGALADRRAECFLWDRYMTSPYVRGGELRRIGVQPTPWPSFVVAAARTLGPVQRAQLDGVLSAVADVAAELAARPDGAGIVVERHHLAAEEAQRWFSETRWAPPGPPDPAMLAEVRDTLASIGLVSAG